jgi:ribose transport system permease protein
MLAEIRQARFVEIIQRNARDFATLGALVAMGLIITIIEPVFLSPANLINVINQSAVNAIIAIGMTFVILSAGIDLSVGSVLAFSGVVMGSIAKLGESGILSPNIAIMLGIAAGLLAGILCGLVNGGFVVFGEMHPFVSTLGMMSIARGLALVWTGGRPVFGFEPAFRFFGAGYIGPFPTQVVLCIVLYAVAWWILKYTKLGRYAYAIGGNEEATRLSGINIGKMKLAFYAINGLTAAIAALVLTARLDSAAPIAGLGFELDAIAAVTIGGTSQRGGEGKIIGSLIGALIISVLRNGLNLMDVSSYIQQIAIGFVIIFAVLLDMKTKRK